MREIFDPTKIIPNFSDVTANPKVGIVNIQILGGNAALRFKEMFSSYRAVKDIYLIINALSERAEGFEIIYSENYDVNILSVHIDDFATQAKIFLDLEAADKENVLKEKLKEAKEGFLQEKKEEISERLKCLEGSTICLNGTIIDLNSEDGVSLMTSLILDKEYGYPTAANFMWLKSYDSYVGKNFENMNEHEYIRRIFKQNITPEFIKYAINEDRAEWFELVGGAHEFLKEE